MEKIIVLDFGSQYTQRIARCIRDFNTYCEIVPYNKFPFGEPDIKGVILSGSSFSAGDEHAFKPDLSSIRGHYPVLGICYGAQYLVSVSGGTIDSNKADGHGCTDLAVIHGEDKLLKGIRKNSQVWMSYSDNIVCLPDNFEIIAGSEKSRIAAYHIKEELTWGVLFHPEIEDTEDGRIILQNFVRDICNCRQDWTPESFIENTVRNLREQLGSDNVVLGLSGGVDSTVTAMLLYRAIGSHLHCVFVDTGLLRKNEFVTVLEQYKTLGLNVRGVDASDRFYEALKGVTDPEQKRKIIGSNFIDVFEEEARKLHNIKWLGQGTIYPDCIESQSVTGRVVKSHHNVGGLPEKMNLKIVEPLKLLFKDEVRRIGSQLNIPGQFLQRHPFPGPGLGVRIIGDITPEKVRILQDADHIFIQGLHKYNLYDRVWQAGAILLPIRSTGIMQAERTYENVVALRAVLSTDAMTAEWAKLPYDFLTYISNEIINKVNGINRVVYDISSKPPATIEWE